MTEVANVLLPLFTVMALGAVLRHNRFASPQLFRETNRLVYWVGLPALLFYTTAESQPLGGSALKVFAVLLGAMLLTIVLGYVSSFVLRLSPRTTSAFVQGSYRSNLAYVGLPIVLLSVASYGGDQTSALEATGVISIALLMPIYNLAAVFVLLAGREGGLREAPRRLREFLLRVATNPLILSCIGGLAVMTLGWKLPRPLRETLVIVGDMTTPLAILGIGASMSFVALRAHARNATVAAILKTLASPLIGLALAALLGLTSPETSMALILLACPTAAASYVMAQQLGSDDELAANVIMMSTVFAVPALAAIMALA
jgi:predicted permease